MAQQYAQMAQASAAEATAILAVYQQHQHMRYPVLQPLLSHPAASIIPVSTACDLIDLYFSSASSVQVHPMSPYVMNSIFRKSSLLHPSKPRVCSPALLASMLWVAAQKSDVSLGYGEISRKLLNLTTSFIPSADVSIVADPHGSGGGNSDHAVNSAAVNGATLGAKMEGTFSAVGEGRAFGAARTLDDIVTYIHLATTTSEHKEHNHVSSWWIAALLLARELKLGHELPRTVTNVDAVDVEADATVPVVAVSQCVGQPEQAELDADGETDDEDTQLRDDWGVEVGDRSNGGTGGSTAVAPNTEEEREERRRVWWLLFVTNRYLALRSDVPILLLDTECKSLLKPLDETTWQSGAKSSANAGINANAAASISTGLNDFTSSAASNPEGSVQGSSPSAFNSDKLPQGPPLGWAGHSIFYFLPQMVILGDALDFIRARNHPRFGVGFRSNREWDQHAEAIRGTLDDCEQNLGNHGNLNFQEMLAETRNLLQQHTTMMPAPKTKKRAQEEPPPTREGKKRTRGDGQGAPAQFLSQTPQSANIAQQHGMESTN